MHTHAHIRTSPALRPITTISNRIRRIRFRIRLGVNPPFPDPMCAVGASRFRQVRVCPVFVCASLPCLLSSATSASQNRFARPSVWSEQQCFKYSQKHTHATPKLHMQLAFRHVRERCAAGPERTGPLRTGPCGVSLRIIFVAHTNSLTRTRSSPFVHVLCVCIF